MSRKTEINIGRKDVFWNYFATFTQIGFGIILYPVILHKLPSEMVGVWAIFGTILSLVALLDFGFDPSFTRNVTYIFSGVNQLEKSGISKDYSHQEINYNLLASTIRAMKWFYSRIALIVFVLLISFGSLYLYHVLSGSFMEGKHQIGIAWILFCVVNTYSIYTFYYDSLVIGSGKIKTNKQIIVTSQLVYLLIAVVLISLDLGLISIVAAQAVSVLIKRVLCYKAFYSAEIRNNLAGSNSDGYKKVINTITPNSIKLGLTTTGSFLVSQSSIIIGSLYLPLKDIASFGITTQLINVVALLSTVYYSSFIPRLSNLRVKNNMPEIRKIYLRSVVMLISTYFICGLAIILLGNWGLKLIGSQTMLLSGSIIIVMLIIAVLEGNHAIAGGFLLSKNEVPFYKASIITGIATVALLVILLKIFNLGILGMILAPGIAQILYQNWKWPAVLIKELYHK